MIYCIPPLIYKKNLDQPPPRVFPFVRKNLFTTDLLRRANLRQFSWLPNLKILLLGQWGRRISFTQNPNKVVLAWTDVCAKKKFC